MWLKFIIALTFKNVLISWLKWGSTCMLSLMFIHVDCKSWGVTSTWTLVISISLLCYFIKKGHENVQNMPQQWTVEQKYRAIKWPHRMIQTFFLFFLGLTWKETKFFLYNRFFFIFFVYVFCILFMQSIQCTDSPVRCILQTNIKIMKSEIIMIIAHI